MKKKLLSILALCAENYYCRQILWFGAVPDLEAIVRQKRRRRSLLVFTSQLKDLELYSIKVYNNSLMAAAIA